MSKHKRRKTRISAVHYNEYDDDPRKQYLAEVKAKKARRRRHLLISCIIIGLIVVYFVSPVSKIQSIQVKGLVNLKADEVKVSIQKETSGYYLFTSTKNIENKLKKHALIKKCHVSKTITGGLRIEIQEAKPVAYAIFQNKTYVIDELAHVEEVSDVNFIKKLESTPRLMSFDSLEHIQTFADQYIQLPYILRNSISDVIFSPKAADPTSIRFVMDNGKQLIVRLNDISKVLSQKKFDYEAYMTEYSDACIFSFEGDSIYITNCQ